MRCRRSPRSRAAWPQLLPAAPECWRYCRDKPDAYCSWHLFYAAFAHISAACRAAEKQWRPPGAPCRNHQNCRLSLTVYRLSFINRHVGIGIFRAHIFRPWPDQPVVIQLLDHMRCPSANARDREYRGEQVEIDSQSVVGGSRVEVDVRVQLLFGLHEVLDFFRHVVPLALPAGFAQIMRHLA